MNPESIDWIAADWGTTRLRCWALSADNEVVDKAESDCGMNALAGQSEAFESSLLDLISPWLRPGETIPVSACGMVGAKQGWIEVPYVEAPCSVRTPTTKAPARSDAIEVFIHAGISQREPPDVMRGEETLLSGLLSEFPDYEGSVCLPGTHSKWCRVEGETLCRFETFLTGELFSLLAERSILRLTLSPDGWDEAAFLEGVKNSFEDPAALLTDCFRLRAEALLNNLDGVPARSRLSGLLIGHELAGAFDRDSLPDRVLLTGSGELAELYGSALSVLPIDCDTLPSERAILAGLSRGRRQNTVCCEDSGPV